MQQVHLNCEIFNKYLKKWHKDFNSTNPKSTQMKLLGKSLKNSVGSKSVYLQYLKVYRFALQFQIYALPKDSLNLSQKVLYCSSSSSAWPKSKSATSTASLARKYFTFYVRKYFTGMRDCFFIGWINWMTRVDDMIFR